MLRQFFSSFHVKETVVLAWPLVLTQIGHIVTGMVDNIFLGHLGPTEQAAGILSNNLFILVLVFGMGMSFAITPLVTTAAESNDLQKKAALLKSSLLLNFIVAFCCFVLLYNLSAFMKYMQQPAEVASLAVPFFDVIIFSMIPISIFFACKQYCEGLSNTKMALLVSVAGNLINILLNYVLIYGKFGFPALGYMGSAWASFYARLFMGVAFLVLVFYSPVTKEIGRVFFKVRVHWAEMAALWKIGINTAMQFTFEVAAFAIAGFMAGSFGEQQIDAHGIALNIAAFTYMFGSGIGSAATIRAGTYRAQKDLAGVRRAAGAAIRLVLLVMGCCGLILLALNRILPLVFTDVPGIVDLAADLLLIAALLQLFDGLQVTIIGLLRGLEDVKMPTLVTLVGYWVLALPLAYFLAFTLKLETIGIWLALLASLVFVSIMLFARLYYLLKTGKGQKLLGF
jgi:multidrug resistance protein, MATE family